MTTDFTDDTDEAVAFEAQRRLPAQMSTRQMFSLRVWSPFVPFSSHDILLLWISQI